MDANTVPLGTTRISDPWYPDATTDELRGELYAMHDRWIWALEELSFLELRLEYEAFLENREFAALAGMVA